ncbi:MAG: ABC transporter ATP-binding protein [Nanoarchaeota archaeon]|nr:ABC transporter ATP-binding protein [Nanoarchaeota archaeon]
MKYVLEVSGLKKTFKNKSMEIKALDGLSFKVKKGEILGLLGPNGAGKTTATNIIIGLTTQDSGKIKFFGKPPCEESRNKINTSTAYKILNGGLTIKQNLKVYAMMYNVKNANEKIDGLLKTFDIYEIRNKLVYDLSSGQKTRVNLCKSLINDPEILFLDEATAGLDPEVALKVRDVIRKLKCTVIFTSHIMSEVEELCDRIAFMKKGKILKVGTLKEIKKLVDENTLIINFSKIPKNYKTILEKYDLLKIKNKKAWIELKNPDDLHNITNDLIKSGFKIKHIQIKEPTLEEIFMHYYE